MNNNFKNISYEPKKVKSNKTFAVFDSVASNFHFGYFFGRWSLLQIVFFTLLFISLFKMLNYTLSDSLTAFRPFDFTSFLTFLEGTEVFQISTNLNLEISASQVPIVWLRELLNFFIAPLKILHWIFANLVNILAVVVQFIKTLYLL